jgi:hypothetical protein
VRNHAGHAQLTSGHHILLSTCCARLHGFTIRTSKHSIRMRPKKEHNNLGGGDVQPKSTWSSPVPSRPSSRKGIKEIKELLYLTLLLYAPNVQSIEPFFNNANAPARNVPRPRQSRIMITAPCVDSSSCPCDRRTGKGNCGVSLYPAHQRGLLRSSPVLVNGNNAPERNRVSHTFWNRH